MKSLSFIQKMARACYLAWTNQTSLNKNSNKNVIFSQSLLLKSAEAVPGFKCKAEFVLIISFHFQSC